MGYSQQERIALCALLDKTGPDAPTLCAGWSTGDLAAHLVIREHRLDAAAGVLGGPLAGHAARVQRRLRERTPFGDLVATLRSGPPRFSPFSLPGMDERLNGVEYFVHHEDVRRAAPGWEPRELPAGEADALWRQLRGSRRMLRRLPVGIELARDDTSNGNLRLTAKNATPAVTVIGPPAELTMWAFGRTSAASVRFDGTQSAVARLSGSHWGPGAPSLPARMGIRSAAAHAAGTPAALRKHAFPADRTSRYGRRPHGCGNQPVIGGWLPQPSVQIRVSNGPFRA